MWRKCLSMVKGAINRNKVGFVLFYVEFIFLILFTSVTVFSKLQTVKEFLYFAVIVCLIVTVLLLFLYLLYDDKPIKYESLFFVSVLLWGTIFSMVLPPFSGHDEQVHFGTAYYISNIIIHRDMNMGVIGGRPDDILVSYGNGSDIFNISPSWYTTIANGNWIGTDLQGLCDIGMPMWTIEKWWEYIPLAIGIVIGRGLNLGHWGLIYFARIFHVIFVAIIGSIAIKISPYGKNQMCFIAMIAGIVRLFSEFNYDTVMLVVEMLVISISLKIYYEEKITKLSIIGIVLCMGYLVLHKMYLFILFIIPVYVIWKKIICSFDRKVKRRIIIATMVVMLVPLLFAIIVKFKFWKAVFFGMNGQSTYLGMETYTLEYIFHNPIDSLRLWWNTITQRGGFILGDYFGSDTARELIIPLGVSALLFLCLIVEIFCGCGKVNKSLRKLSIVVALLLLFVEVFGAQLRFTNVCADYIASFYGRYTYPNIIVFMILGGKSVDKQQEKFVRCIYYVENLLLTISICFLLYEIFGREYYRYGEFLW